MPIKIKKSKLYFLALLTGASFLVGVYYLGFSSKINQKKSPSPTNSQSSVIEKMVTLPPPQKLVAMQSLSGKEALILDPDGVNGQVKVIGKNTLTIEGRSVTINPRAKIVLDRWPSGLSNENPPKFPKEGRMEDIKVGDVVNTYFLAEQKNDGVYFILVYK